MAVTEGPFAGPPVSVTDGVRKLTFDTPTDFADWADQHAGESLERWHWVPAVLVVSDN
jgi:hypothetical protein